MATAAPALPLLEAAAVAAHQDQLSGESGCQPERSGQDWCEFEMALHHVAPAGHAVV